MCKKGDVGMGQNETIRGPQVLVYFSLFQGKPYWGNPIFDPQPRFEQPRGNIGVEPCPYLATPDLGQAPPMR